MSECSRFFHDMADLRQGSLGDAEQQALYTHLASCAECRDLFGFHDELAEAGTETDEPLPEVLAAVRSRVIGEISQSQQPPAQEPARGEQSGWSRRWLPMAATVLLALLAGFFGARISGGSGSGSEEDLLLAALERTASENLNLRDVEDSASVISNVVVRPVANGRIVMSFDVAQHLELERSAQDPLVNEVLVHAMLDQSSLGSRLKAVSMAGNASNLKVQEAMVFTMVNDPALPVRLRALEMLANTPRNAAVEHGLLQVLRHDDSTQMRLMAVDFLAGGPGSRRGIVDDLLDDRSTLDPAVANRLIRITNS